MTPNLAAPETDVRFMENDYSPVRALGFLSFSIAAVGVVSLAFISAVNPAVQGGVMRFLLLMAVSFGILMAVIWTGVASVIAIRWRVRESE
jgi:hypothetical protein